MVLHGVAHDVGHLVEAAVVEGLHGVQYAALHGLEAVVDVWHGALENHIRGIVQKPVAVHALKAVTHNVGRRVKSLAARCRLLWSVGVFG